MTGIRLEGITKLYDSPGGIVRAVDDVTLSIAPGEFFFLLGPSGCGKTTLLRIVAALTEPTAGRVWFGQRDVTSLPPHRRNAAMVFQSYALWPHMTVAQNVAFGPKMQRVTRQRRRELVKSSLARVEMQAFSRRKPNQLSGGQQQRVAVARALAAQTEYLLFDEPLSNLDARLRMHMRGELRRLVKSKISSGAAGGITAVYVTHDQKEALSMADRVAVMNAGKIVQVGTPQEIYNRPATRFVADFLGEANFIDGQVAGLDAHLRIETPAGALLAEAEHAPKGAVRVSCCVRPERIRIAPATEAAEGADVAGLPAAVESRTYLGETCQYLCRLSNQDVWKVSMLSTGHDPFPPGRQVALLVGPQDVIVLPA